MKHILLIVGVLLAANAQEAEKKTDLWRSMYGSGEQQIRPEENFEGRVGRIVHNENPIIHHEDCDKVKVKTIKVPYTVTIKEKDLRKDMNGFKQTFEAIKQLIPLPLPIYYAVEKEVPVTVKVPIHVPKPRPKEKIIQIPVMRVPVPSSLTNQLTNAIINKFLNKFPLASLQRQLPVPAKIITEVPHLPQAKIERPVPQLQPVPYEAIKHAPIQEERQNLEFVKWK